MGKKIIILLFFILPLVGCDVAMDNFGVTNGSKYIVTSKRKDANDYHYTYRIIKVGDKWYDYYYIDTTSFNVGDTLVINIKRVERE